jgi:paraquat-inducible protein B
VSEPEPTPDPAPIPAATPQLRAAQRWNIVWVVPILAVLLGAWMIYRNFSSQGPVAYVRFETADGLAAGKTEIRCRSVRVGVVKTLSLADDLKSVIVSVELNPDLGVLLRQDTHFWVVRPRVSATDISGLGTLITGAYLELDPGPASGPAVNHFDGLETPPATNQAIPGLRISLTANQAGSLVAGSPLYYRGFEVGRIENRKLDLLGERLTYDAFIRKEFSGLVKENTRFWNTSGIDISGGANGFKLRTPSLQALVAGGATFGIPDGAAPGPQAKDGASFNLFDSEEAANNASFNPTMKFLLLFEQGVRGLEPGAPVEFRGIPVGRVAGISFDYMPVGDDSRIPVLIELDPSLLRREATEKISKPDTEYLKDAVQRGLRASLRTGSLLTGALYVDFDYYKYPMPAELTKVGEFSSIPTISSGLAQLETKVGAILDKIESLPLEDTMKKISTLADEAAITAAESRKTLKELEQAAAAISKTVDSPEFAKLPKDLRGTLAALEKSVASIGPDGAIQGDLLRTLDELRAALRAVNQVSTTIDENPDSLIFGRDSSRNSVPKAPTTKR